jgi:hypothetical protein
MFSPSEGSLQLIAACVFALGIGAILLWSMVQRRPSDADRERHRRSFVNAGGRMVDGYITDVKEGVLYYSYSVAGVDYVAAQELADLPVRLPEDGIALIGPATVKYSPNNPANSIVFCESWSGIRSGSERNFSV